MPIIFSSLQGEKNQLMDLAAGGMLP
jgi:hypothetical protein